jgi:hypothetical protein
MKYLIIYSTFLFSIVSHAQINVLCGNLNAGIDCQSTSSSLLSTRSRQVLTPTGEGYRPSSELIIKNFNNDIVDLEADSSSPSGLISILTDNKGSKADYKIIGNGILTQGYLKMRMILTYSATNLERSTSISVVTGGLTAAQPLSCV